MNSKIFLLIMFFGLINSIFAVEVPLSYSGLTNKSLNEFNAFECFNIEFSSKDYFDDVEGLHPILSIYADFEGKEFDSSFISVEINNNKQIFWKENFDCSDRCVARMFVDKINNGDKIEFCMRTGFSTIKMHSDSKIGFYDTPVLKIENIPPEEITLGQRAKMKINVKNTGSKNADIFVQFVAEDLRSIIKITSFDIVEGEASASTTINSNTETDFVFYIKPILSGSYNLPSSELFFTNVFGEKQRILSNHPRLLVNEPNQAEITLIGGEIFNNQLKFNVKIKNNWGSVLDGNLIIFPFDLINNSEKPINVNAFSEKEFSFTTEKLISGEYSLQAQLNTIDFNYYSESINFSISEQDYFFEIFFSIIAIIITLGIFLTIYFSKN